MIRLESVSAVRSWRSGLNDIGFVPTMGALHDGHLNLIRRAREANRHVVASIFVNPTQFNDPSDLERYPRPLNDDLELLDRAGIDAVFLPNADEIYADQYRYKISESNDALVACGATRPGHFDGVLTVVMKLLQIVHPSHAYFGEKDYQQLRLIQGLAKTFFLEAEIVPCPTVREPDGLAMSSRNRLLTPDQRERAPALYHALHRTASEARMFLEERGFRVDYIEEHWGRRLGAAFLGSVRLIDNVQI